MAGLTVCKADHTAQKGIPAGPQVVLVACKVVLDSCRVDSKGIPAGRQVVLIEHKVVLGFQRVSQDR